MPSNVAAGAKLATGFLDTELMELSLLVPSWQVTALDSLARAQGLSIGQMIRRVITTLVAEGAVCATMP